MSWSRRRFNRWLGGCAGVVIARPALGEVPAPARARARVVVIGGGPGGATVARTLGRYADRIAVTLVEASRTYTTCFFSNLYLGGLRSLDSITQDYARLASDRGITLIHDSATGIDPARRTVRLESGTVLGWDRLVLAPGIDFRFEAIEGYDGRAAQVMPHAWKAGPQTVLLRKQLEAMDDGALVVVAPPRNPFRCPPGPYERVCMIAWYLKRTKPASKILVLDSKDSFSKQDLFMEAWQRYYPGMIEWIPASFTGGVQAVDSASMSVMTAEETFRPAVANIIPPQLAGRIARQAGCADETGWCPVDAATLESIRQPGIHVVGDAIDPGDMPKSAFAAGSQARVCAMAVTSALLGEPVPAPRFANTCWSHLAENDAVVIGASYEPRAGKIRKVDGFVSKAGESRQRHAETSRAARAWYAGFVDQVFG